MMRSSSSPNVKYVKVCKFYMTLHAEARGTISGNFSKHHDWFQLNIFMTVTRVVSVLVHDNCAQCKWKKKEETSVKIVEAVIPGFVRGENVNSSLCKKGPLLLFCFFFFHSDLFFLKRQRRYCIIGKKKMFIWMISELYSFGATKLLKVRIPKVLYKFLLAVEHC